MPNQRAIAAAAGVTQAAVSKALRGDRSIPAKTRQRIEAIAHSLGYRPNSYVSTLMAHIRSGRPLRDKGCIALLVDAASEKDWLGSIGGYTYRMQCEGILQRAQALGFTTEYFYLRPLSNNPSRINRILDSRGINGLILIPRLPERLPYPAEIQLTWERYAMATIAYTWGETPIDRVSTHHRHNVEIAFTTLLQRGYARIGMCLPPEAVENVDYSWRERHLLWQNRLPAKSRIPLFVGKPGITSTSKFKAWLNKWRPDALVCLIGHEIDWLNELGIQLPKDMGLVCVNRPPTSQFSGVEENHEVIGAAAMDSVAAQIQRNEYGFPAHPKLILIEGTWVEGKSLRPAQKTAARRKSS